VTKKNFTPPPSPKTTITLTEESVRQLRLVRDKMGGSLDEAVAYLVALFSGDGGAVELPRQPELASGPTYEGEIFRSHAIVRDGAFLVETTIHEAKEGDVFDDGARRWLAGMYDYVWSNKATFDRVGAEFDRHLDRMATKTKKTTGKPGKRPYRFSSEEARERVRGANLGVKRPKSPETIAKIKATWAKKSAVKANKSE